MNSIEPEDDDGNNGRVGTAMTINVLLFLLLQTYGGWVVSGVTREKSSRVVEVLLSTVTARQLMFGKILGVGIVALIHASVMVVTALVTAKIVGLDVLDGFRPGDLAVGAIWFLLGYALCCCAFAAAGSLATRSEDAQGVTVPVMLPLIAGYIIGFSAGGGANTLLWVLAFFPPTAVLCMPVLSATGEVAIWMVVLSMVITAAAASRRPARGTHLRPLDPQDRQTGFVEGSAEPEGRRSRLTTHGVPEHRFARPNSPVVDMTSSI